jgi:hypothetical protein
MYPSHTPLQLPHPLQHSKYYCKCASLVVKVHTSLTSSTFKFPGGYFTDTMNSNGSRDSSVTLLIRQWAGWLRNYISTPKLPQWLWGLPKPTMGTRGHSPVGNVAKMWNWPLASNTGDAINDRSYIYFHSTITKWFTTTTKKKKIPVSTRCK